MYYGIAKTEDCNEISHNQLFFLIINYLMGFEARTSDIKFDFAPSRTTAVKKQILRTSKIF